MGYEQWKAERRHLKETGQPFPASRRHDRPGEPENMLGYWRQENARTKADTPIAIWKADGQPTTIFQFGAMRPISSDEQRDQVDDFIGKGWLKCVAVTRDEWSAALEAGQWADGKVIRMPTEAEQADIIPTTPAADGGNAESGDVWDQVKERLETGAHNVKAIGIIDNIAKANNLAAVVEGMRAAWKIGEQARKAAKAPFDAGAKAVQEKWQPMLDDLERTAKGAVAAIQKFRDAEEARLRAEERQRREAEERRIREETEARLRAEAEARALQAEQMGMEVEPQSDEELAEQAREETAQQMQQMPEADTTVRVGTAAGRGIAKPKITRGRITDVDAFFAAIKDHEQTKDFLQTIADRLARNGVPVAGMVSYRE
jgi:hypothetical protein